MGSKPASAVSVVHSRGCFLPSLGSRRIVGQQQCRRFGVGSCSNPEVGQRHEDGFTRLLAVRQVERESRRLPGMAAPISSRLAGEDSKPSMRKETDGIIIVDHGSRRAESNAMLSRICYAALWMGDGCSSLTTKELARTCRPVCGDVQATDGPRHSRTCTYGKHLLCVTLLLVQK